MPNCTRFTVRSGALESVVDILLLLFAQNREIQLSFEGNFAEPARTKSKRRGNCFIFHKPGTGRNSQIVFIFSFSVSGKKILYYAMAKSQLTRTKALFHYWNLQKRDEKSVIHNSRSVQFIFHLFKPLTVRVRLFVSAAIKKMKTISKKEKKFQCRRTTASVRFRHIIRLEFEMSCEKEKWLTEMDLRVKWLVGQNEAALHWTEKHKRHTDEGSFGVLQILRNKIELWSVPENAANHSRIKPTNLFSKFLYSVLGFNLKFVHHSVAPGICTVDIVSSTLLFQFSGKKCRIDNMGRELSIFLVCGFSVSSLEHLRYTAQSSYCTEFTVQWSSACCVHWHYLLSQLNAVCCLWQPFSQFSLWPLTKFRLSQISENQTIVKAMAWYSFCNQQKRMIKCWMRSRWNVRCCHQFIFILISPRNSKDNKWIDCWMNQYWVLIPVACAHTRVHGRLLDTGWMEVDERFLFLFWM